MNKFVTMGFAATHYSLALSSDGNIYEWGMYICSHAARRCPTS
jgi:alpha-tubulin suppressor-like RCC1 family protein